MSSVAVDPASEEADVVAPSNSRSFTNFTKRHTTLICVVLLFVGTLCLYARTLSNDFVNYDDPRYVTRNPIVQSGLTWSNIKWAFISTSEANWHPLTWVSHMADAQWFGLYAAGHHLHSNILHAINVVLLFLLLWRASGSHLKSLLAAAMFAVHPLNVESVAWIAERKSVLSTLFFLLALAAYGLYVHRRSVGRYLGVTLCFALGLMAKPMVITLPFCLLLLDYWPLDRFERKDGGPPLLRVLRGLVLEKIPLFAMSAASAAITIYAQKRGGAVRSLGETTLSQRFANAVYSYAKYLEKGVWPSGLAVFYPHPAGTLAVWKVLLAAVVLLIISAIVWRYRQRRYLVVGWLWYLGTMVPVIGLVQVGRQAMADRYAYLPFWGLFVMTVWVGSDLLPRRLPSLKSGCAIAVFCFAILTYTQIGYWRDSYTLFSHALQVMPENGVAEGSLGAALADMGLQNQATSHLLAAIRVSPDFLPAHYTLGMIFQRQGRLEDAQREYQFVIQNSADPMESSQAHNNLGVLFSQMNLTDRAVQEFDAAVRINPNERNSFLGRGAIEYQRGEPVKAIQDFRRAAEIAPSATTYLWLASACELNKDPICAVQAYEEALRLNPGMSEAQSRLKRLRGENANPGK